MATYPGLGLVGCRMSYVVDRVRRVEGRITHYNATAAEATVEVHGEPTRDIVLDPRSRPSWNSVCVCGLDGLDERPTAGWMDCMSCAILRANGVQVLRNSGEPLAVIRAEDAVQKLALTVPLSWTGQPLRVRTPAGRMVQLRVPPGAQPGERLETNVPVAFIDLQYIITGTYNREAVFPPRWTPGGLQRGDSRDLRRGPRQTPGGLQRGWCSTAPAA